METRCRRYCPSSRNRLVRIYRSRFQAQEDFLRSHSIASSNERCRQRATVRVYLINDSRIRFLSATSVSFSPLNNQPKYRIICASKWGTGSEKLKQFRVLVSGGEHSVDKLARTFPTMFIPSLPGLSSANIAKKSSYPQCRHSST